MVVWFDMINSSDSMADQFPVTHLFRKRVATVFVAVFACSSSIVLLGVDPAHAVANPALLPSLGCAFTEPFFAIDVSTEGLVMRSAEGGTSLGQFQSARGLGSKKATYVFKLGGESKELVITDEPGSDGMSNFDYAKTARWGSFVGGCMEYPKGYVPRQVVNVAKNDTLNIRSAPRASARIVDTTTNSSWLFVKPAATKWRAVAFEKVPPNEAGKIGVGRGWVNSAFLAKPVAAN